MYLTNHHSYRNRIKPIKIYIKCSDICSVLTKIETITTTAKADKHPVTIPAIAPDDNWFESSSSLSLLLFFRSIGLDGFGPWRSVGHNLCSTVNERHYRKLLRRFLRIICRLKRLKISFYLLSSDTRATSVSLQFRYVIEHNEVVGTDKIN